MRDPKFWSFADLVEPHQLFTRYSRALEDTCRIDALRERKSVDNFQTSCNSDDSIHREHDAGSNRSRPHYSPVIGGVPCATIRIQNLRLRTFIGFNPDERTKRQDVVINIALRYAINQGVFGDRVDEALNYKTITKEIIGLVEEGHFLLLEKLAADTLAVCTKDHRVEYACVTVDKPHALRFADSVAITLEHHGTPLTDTRSN